MDPRSPLLASLPPDLHDDVERVVAELTQADENLDPRDVIGALHGQGLIDDDTLRSSLLEYEAESPVAQMRARPPEGDAAAHKVLGPLGAGAMGEVLLARDAGLNRVVAVKRLHPDFATRQAMLRRFYTEAQVTAQLDHPGIVPIHGLVNLGDDSLAYAMKLVRGQTLEDYLEEAREAWRKQGRDDPAHGLPRRLERFLHVCDAMAYAHDKGVVHRDLKPENIMVGAHGEVLVMDWGIAKVLATPEELTTDGEEVAQPKSQGGTKVGTVMGTPRYMSPEQAVGANDVLDARSDQYTLGLILFEVVSLAPAMWGAETLEEAVAKSRAAKKQPLEHFHPSGSIPRELAAIVHKATKLDANARYDDVHALAEDVRRYLRDEAPLAAPDGLFGRMQRWVSHHRRGVLGLIAGLAMLTVAGGTTLVALALTALEVQRYAAAVHEEELTRTLRHAVKRADDIDVMLHRAEAGLGGIAYVAQARRSDLRGTLEAVREQGAKVGGTPLIRYAEYAPKSGSAVGSPKNGRDSTSTSQAWYKRALKSRYAVWAAPRDGASGLVATGALRVLSSGGSAVGVASIDLDLEAAAGSALKLPPGAEHAFLVDSDGYIVAQSGVKASGTYKRKKYPNGEVWKEIHAARSEGSGYVERDRKLVVWSRLSAADWTFVVSGNAKKMTARKPKKKKGKG